VEAIGLGDAVLRARCSRTTHGLLDPSSPVPPTCQARTRTQKTLAQSFLMLTTVQPSRCAVVVMGSPAANDCASLA